jgi:hypothetical protein
MNVDSTMLDRFQQLTENHKTQFEPQITIIQQRLDIELAQLQQQETELVQAQSQLLQELRGAISTDARFLLATPQFQSFMASIHRYSQAQVNVSTEISDWLLHQSTIAIGVSDYREDVDYDAYNDERTYTQYNYSVAIKWGDQARRIGEIEIRRGSGSSEDLNDREDQIEEIVDGLLYFYDHRKKTQEEKILMLEAGHLIYYACTLLKLQPQRVQLIYDSTAKAE